MTTDDMIKARDDFSLQQDYLTPSQCFEAGWLACQRQINAEMQGMLERVRIAESPHTVTELSPGVFGSIPGQDQTP
jgi:hypothetical protein